MKNVRMLSLLALASFLSGCADIHVAPETANVDIVIKQPNMTKCEFLGDVVGAKGKWSPAKYTSHKEIILGARNELRNETSKLGGNVVFVQDMQNATAMGKAYRCTD